MTDDVSFFNPVNLKTAVDIGKTLLSLARQAESKGLDAKYAADLNDKIAEMQFALFDAQSDALASQEAQSKQSARIRELEQTIAEFEDWETEKARYKLVNTSEVAGLAGYVYLLRKEAAYENEPLHYICPKCYYHKIKSILQGIIRGESKRDICPECGATFTIIHDIARSHGVIS